MTNSGYHTTTARWLVEIVEPIAKHTLHDSFQLASAIKEANIKRVLARRRLSVYKTCCQWKQWISFVRSLTQSTSRCEFRLTTPRICCYGAHLRQSSYWTALEWSRHLVHS